MVEKYFDKAGVLTNIKAYKLNFYKKADKVVEFNLTLTRCKNFFIKTIAAFKSLQPIAASIQRKEELDMLKMLTFIKFKT